MTEVIYQVQSSRADGREDENGVYIYTYADLLFGTTAGDVNLQWQFLRFINIDIPQGADIDSAIIEFSGRGGGSGTPPDIDIYAEANGNPGTTISANGSTGTEISGRPRTTNTVAWTNPPSIVLLEKLQSPDIKTIIQELVDRSDWQRGNAINIIFDVDDPGSANNFNDVYAYDGNSTLCAKITINYTVKSPSGSITQITQPKTKQFFHKIFDKDGVYIATWGKEVLNAPNYKWKINGGMGEQKILLKRMIEDFGENDDVKMGNIIETWIQDGDQEIGRLVWSGVLNRYEPKITANGDEVIDVRGVSKLIEYEKRIYQSDAELTTDTKSSKDPSDILREIITSKYGASLFKIGNIEDTGTSVTFTFTSNTYREVLDNIIMLAPQYWYWRLLPDNTIDFKFANYDEIDHVLYVGKEANNVVMTKTIEPLINKVYFMGGGDPNLYRVYERTSSQDEFGLREKFIKDERVTVTDTAETISTRILDDFDHPLSQIEITVLDSNIDPKNGYDIERFKPGQIIQILHPKRAFGYTLWDEATWDVDYWDFSITQSFGVPHQIIEIDYQFNQVILKVSAKLEDTNKRIEDINRNLKETAKINIPVNPT